MKANKPHRIAMLGALPPPYGGISIDLQRLMEKVKGDTYECIVYDLLNHRESRPDGTSKVIKNIKWWALKYFLSAREDIIHCHYVDWRSRAMMGLMALCGKKTVISICGQSLHDSLKNAGWLKREIIKFALRRISFVIAQNQNIERLCLSIGVKRERIKFIPGFIPPVPKEKEMDEVPEEVWDFIRNHHPVISANAPAITHYNNEDLYGIDMCVDLCANLKSNYPEIGFVFSLPANNNNDYFHEILKRIKDKHIEGNFLFQTKPCQFYPILMKSQVFVRPTNTEGDATSLREALFFRVASVASDVVPRPEGTIIFKSRDIEDFTMKVRDVLNNDADYKKRLETVKLEDNAREVIRVYQRLSSNDS